jgi:uncharacterized protein YkwD
MNITSTPFRIALRAAPVIAAFALAGCGGGGSSSTDTAAAPAAGGGNAPAAPATPATPAGPAAPAVTAGSTCNISAFAATALDRINAVRAAGADCHTGGRFAPAAPLAWSAKLTQAAEGHSQDMVAKNFFSHTGSNGSTLSTRVNAAGYVWNALGENIAAGYVGIDAVMNGWVASDGHCANLMNPSFKEVGLVCVPGTPGSYSTYWTMDLGASN